MIRLFVMDVDGTLTDGKIYMGPNGEVMKAFHVKDGYAIAHLLQEADMIPIILTGRESEIVTARCRELHIQEVYQGVSDKLVVLCAAAEKYGVSLSQIAYIGDDVTDLPCMELCGVVGCPADAVTEVRERADFVCTLRGGEGAVREFAEWILKTKDRK